MSLMSMRRLNKSRCRSITNSAAFTLIEVMISLLILVIIGTATSKAVIDAAGLKEKLKDETEFSSEFRTSITLIERDLNQVFNPRWFLSPDQKPLDLYAPPTPPATMVPGVTPPLSAQEINNKLRGSAFQASEYWSTVFDASGLRPSRFKGDDHSMSFVAASHVRIYQQKKESIYAKIKYDIIKQPPNSNLSKEQNDKISNYSSLIKIENTHAFELEEAKDVPYVQTYTILNQIKKIKFSYFKIGEKTPATSWDSEAADTKGIFPEAIQMELSLEALNGRTLDATILFKLEAPNEVLPKTY